MSIMSTKKSYITGLWHYMLKGKKITRTKDLYEWADWIEFAVRTNGKKGNVVKQSMLNNGLFVSTVFLGVDYSFSDKGPPILFETMVFDTTKKTKHKVEDSEWESLGEDLYQKRYSTYGQAEKGHELTVKKFKHYMRN